MITKATVRDASTVSLMAIKMWPDNTFDRLIKEFTDIISHSTNVIFICYDNGLPVGFAQCQLRYDYVEGTKTSPVAYLEGIFVEPEFRGKGYSKEMLFACENWAKQMGCSEFASDCELNNLASLAFHKNMGFTEANRIICFTKKI